jgi:hypothetical protein
MVQNPTAKGSENSSDTTLSFTELLLFPELVVVGPYSKSLPFLEIFLSLPAVLFSAEDCLTAVIETYL